MEYKTLRCSCGCGKERVEVVGGTYEIMAFGCKESIERSYQDFLVKYDLTDSK